MAGKTVANKSATLKIVGWKRSIKDSRSICLAACDPERMRTPLRRSPMRTSFHSAAGSCDPLVCPALTQFSTIPAANATTREDSSAAGAGPRFVRHAHNNRGPAPAGCSSNGTGLKDRLFAYQRLTGCAIPRARTHLALRPDFERGPIRYRQLIQRRLLARGGGLTQTPQAPQDLLVGRGNRQPGEGSFGGTRERMLGSGPNR